MKHHFKSQNFTVEPEKMFAALGHPLRVKIIQHLSKLGPISAKIILDQLKSDDTINISMQAFLKHLKILEESGVLRRSKQGRYHCCEINAKSIEYMIEWLASQNYFWQISIDRLEQTALKQQLDQETI